MDENSNTPPQPEPQKKSSCCASGGCGAALKPWQCSPCMIIWGIFFLAILAAYIMK